MTYRIYATCDIGEEALARLREKGWELEVHDEVELVGQGTHTRVMVDEAKFAERAAAKA